MCHENNKYRKQVALLIPDLKKTLQDTEYYQIKRVIP